MSTRINKIFAMLEYLCDDVILLIIDFLNVTDYYSLKSTNKHLYQLIPNEKRSGLLKTWEKIKQKIHNKSKWDAKKVFSHKNPFCWKTFYVHDFGLLIKCLYLEQINKSCNFYNLHVFGITRDQSCYQLFWCPILRNIEQSPFRYYYSRNHLVIQNQENQFQIKYQNDDLVLINNKRDFNMIIDDPQWGIFKNEKAKFSSKSSSYYEKIACCDFYICKSIVYHDKDYQIYANAGRYLILKVIGTQSFEVFDFKTRKIYQSQLNVNNTEASSCTFIYLSQSKKFGVIIQNTCFIFQLVDSIWVIEKQSKSFLSARYFGFCENEQRLIKFF